MPDTNRRIFSFEFFPPKTAEGMERLRVTRDRLASLGPAYFSVTFGAGGSTREGTFETVRQIQESGHHGAPHISCIGTTHASIRDMLDAYREIGVTRLVALRGDIPSGMVERGDFRHANELVSFIREQSGDRFHIEVAAYPEYHPEAAGPAKDLANFQRKVAAGADSALTQYFYNPDAYFRFVAACRDAGIDIPIVPGVMPITNYKQLARFSDGCGAEIPRWLRGRLLELQDDLPALRAFGLDVVTELCETLLARGAPGLHFYTLNRYQAVQEIWRRLQANGHL
jgi:methylenetetrahydrofolate reductase (NADPH)